MLKYLFVAKFNDGTVYEQNEQDVSQTDPTKSCFYDILQLEKEVNGVKQNPVDYFCLTDGENTYLVCIKEGWFDINGRKFFLHDKEIPLTNYRLIFFRRKTHSFSLNCEQVNSSCSYILGFQANNHKGENVKHTIEFE
jgi:hypothetical protein